MELIGSLGSAISTIKNILLAIYHYFLPYKKDKEVYETIKGKLENFYQYIKSKEAGEQFLANKIELLHGFYEQEYDDIELFFLTSKLEKSYQKLKNSIKDLSENLSEMYSLNNNSSNFLVMNSKPQNRIYVPDEQRDTIEKTYKEEKDVLNGSIQSFVASYEEFKKKSIDKLDIERIKN